MEHLGLADLLQHRRVAGKQRTHGDPFARQRQRQRAGDIGEAAGLHQRIDFGRDGENFHGSSVADERDFGTTRLERMTLR